MHSSLRTYARTGTPIWLPDLAARLLQCAALPAQGCVWHLVDTDEAFLFPSCLVGWQQCFACKTEGISDTASPGRDIYNVHNACACAFHGL